MEGTEETEEDRLSFSISDDEEDKDSLRGKKDEKRSWHRPESRPRLVEQSDSESEELSPSPSKRFREDDSDMSDTSLKGDQEEGEILSDDSVEESKLNEGGDVATRDHSPPDSYSVTSDKSPGTRIQVNRVEESIETGLEDKGSDTDEIEVSISQENQDDSLFDFGSKDTDELKESSQSPRQDDLILDDFIVQKIKAYSASSEGSVSSTSQKGHEEFNGDKAGRRGKVESDDNSDGEDIDKKNELLDLEDSSSDLSDNRSPKEQVETKDVKKETVTDIDVLFKQREHPVAYHSDEVTSTEGLFKPRKVKDKEDSEGKQFLDDSDESISDHDNVDHLEITVPQHTVHKERKVKIQKRNEGLGIDSTHLVEDISDDEFYISDRSGKSSKGHTKYNRDEFRTHRSISNPSDTTRVKDKSYSGQERDRDTRRRDEGQAQLSPQESSDLLGQLKKKVRTHDRDTDRWKKGDRNLEDRDYDKVRGHKERMLGTERYKTKTDYTDDKKNDKSKSKSATHVKSQVHVFAEAGRPKGSSDLDLRRKILEKQKAKSYYEKSDHRVGQSRAAGGEKKIETRSEPRQVTSSHLKEKNSKKYQKEQKLKKKSKHKEEKDGRKSKRGIIKSKASKKERKRKKEVKRDERPKRRDKDEEDPGSSGNSETTSDSESHHSSDETLEDDHVIDEYIQLRKTGDDSGNEQGYDDISSAESDMSPVPSPVELKKPPYYPGIQGCRSVEEFEWLNRIEEGTYGVVYRARDRRTDDIVALKRLKMEKEREGFPITSLREINTLLKSQHPNIVTVREIVVGSNMDKIYIVMDYVAHDLKALMEVMTQPFLSGEVKTLMIQLLRGVQHLHDNWILHRDIKTSNLLLSHNGILKIGDFGLAREYGSPLKLYTPIVVTLWYRAPELLLGMKEYSTAIDVWSIGCVFAELLMMKPLFPGKSEIDQLNRIFKELGTPNDKIWPGPPAFSELPMVKKTSFADHPYHVLRQRFGTSLTDKGFNLLNRFLTYDPKKRITSDEGLNHEYFKESPLPVDPSMFPTWPAKSEGHRVARKHNASPKPPEGGQYDKQMADDEPGLFGFHMPAPVKGVASKGPGFSLKF